MNSLDSILNTRQGNEVAPTWESDRFGLQPVQILGLLLRPRIDISIKKMYSMNYEFQAQPYTREYNMDCKLWEPTRTSTLTRTHRNRENKKEG